MKYNVGEVVKGFDGKPFTEQESAKDKVPVEVWLTIAKLIVNALLAFIDGKHLSGEDKFKRYKLAEKIYGKDEVEISLEEANLIKQASGEALTPMFSGKVWDFLEKPKAEKEEPKKEEAK